ncbi:hypothetical protein OO013_08370 [Mangrovivirga sp. M17]|uniref:Uncharacterized protein n=1 Tax=Mangrovivirga halotolerans TaxID=2993936 RepID=A0ABT3RQM9_9BACT|nr:hypothetical protein [Mangrovivirga halotolerans]MCX2743877.1 hypothetical protein [Mangrovivirga halotolerans]
MTEPVVIDKNRTLLPAKDYNYLRSLGIEHIQKLSGKLWTDHNSHDPGITILEILSYALTDLSYRTSFDMKDILTRPNGGFDKPDISSFFPAHEILTSNPLSIIDYRKLLVKIEGIKNAWLNPMTDSELSDYRSSEIPIFANCKEEKLDFKPQNDQGKDNHPIKLTGLYKVLLELEIDDKFGSLNDYDLIYVVAKGPLKGLKLNLSIQDEKFVDKDLPFEEDFTSLTIDNPPAEIFQGIWQTGLTVEYSNGTIISFTDVRIRIISDKPDSDLPSLEVTSTKLENVLLDKEENSLFPVFWAKQQSINKILNKACCVLNAHRNLSEDFLKIDIVKSCRISICADMILKPDADIELVQAKTYHAIEQYFNPQLKFYTLSELLEEGISTDEIFNGPFIDYDFKCSNEKVFTKPGFNKVNELKATQLRRFIHTSDIINILMDFEEVVAVKNVLLRKYDSEGKPIGDSQKWCMEIPPDHQPFLYLETSKILFYKNNIPYTAKTIEFENTLNQLRELSKKSAYVSLGQILPVEPGKYRNIDEYFTIQDDLPLNYGISEEGLPSSASPERRAKAKQLKGYLTFYDQLLADYLQQLSNFRKLFSLDTSVKQTYFSKYLDNSIMTGVDKDFESEMYIEDGGVPALSNNLKRNKLTESNELYYIRKNQILDHLLARFAEQFTDYVMMSYSLDGDKLKIGDDLIEDKTSFLKLYPKLSRERGKAFNYRPEDLTEIWNTKNVSGFEKRLSRLLGISSYLRRDLHCNEIVTTMAKSRKTGNKHQAVFKDQQNKIIFKSKEKFDKKTKAQENSTKVFQGVRFAESYSVNDNGSGNYHFTISGGGITLTHDEIFNSPQEAYEVIHNIIKAYDQILNSDDICIDEGFHLIEHILLRPFHDNDPLMSVCLPEDCDFCGEEDPYSFRVSLVLPYWPGRFNNMHFRQFFEQMARKEIPAHIHLKICWVSNEQMKELDEKYKTWLEAKADKDIDPSILSSALGDLLSILQNLKTINPKATLHDCEEDGDENPVRLGNTNLGIF